MISNVWKRLFLFGFVLTFCVGFETFPGVKGWEIDRSTTAGRKVFITLSTSGRTLENDLPAGDALAGAGAILTEAQLLASVIADYNSIYNSSLILALDSDPDFVSHNLNRRILIEEGDAAGVSSGEARQTFSNRYIIGCEVTLTDAAYEGAKGYVALLTHELGHCMGLDHPQSTVWSVMSYFYKVDEVYRLAIDDKMGIVHLYGTTPGQRNEKATGGLSCSTN